MSTNRLSQKELNRALLERQMLLERSGLNPLDAIERLAGLQSQAPMPPYYALWSRLRDFKPEQLSELLLGRQVARIALMRSTIHLVSAHDCLLFRPVLQPVLERSLMGTYKRDLSGVDLELLLAEARTRLAEQPQTFEELGKHLLAKWPASSVNALSGAVRCLIPLVQLPPRGVWGQSGGAIHAPVDEWLGRPLVQADEQDLLELARRYLRVFGPASAKDMGVWSGLTKLGTVFARLRPELRAYRDEAGQELFDLADMPLPPGDAPAPARFLSEFDNMLLSFHDRSRIMAPEYKPLVFTINGIIKSTFLVDGFVQGLWNIETSKKSAVLRLRPFRSLAVRDRESLEEEGLRLLTFAEPGLDHSIVWEPAIGS
ncbi:winged helix DNA-binding domain-containing protein [Paenibacillus sp. LHD-117]|uniref:winged helix DNA-binding domain-containing protein n=1 Tax=Paenibacillus sp. LHD-117 TaxID=3071412 RepID=UPI0027E1F952|nr:winged helix DNA-binding domain-containing protein [Paenibacillus sp. LHD-117]MDQ6423169.1 winged helix DNA-binding domain-containing protein [Paenibacillus sp. LHD-117]